MMLLAHAVYATLMTSLALKVAGVFHSLTRRQMFAENWFCASNGCHHFAHFNSCIWGSSSCSALQKGRLRPEMLRSMPQFHSWLVLGWAEI